MMFLLSACGTRQVPTASDPSFVDPWSVQAPAALLASSPYAMVTRALAPAGSSPWTVVGAVVTGGKPVPTAWASTDSVRWTATALPLSAGHAADGEVVTAARLGSDVIALGTLWRGDVPRLTAWIERGGTWSAVPDDGVPNLTDAQVSSMAAGPDAVVAVGSALDVHGHRQPAVWRSADGSTWQARRLALGPDVTLSAVAVANGVTVIAGSVIRVPAGPGQPLPTASAAFWWSTDSSVWHAAQTPGVNATGDQTVSGVTVFRDRFVAGGWTRLRPNGSYGWVASSTDGRSWQAQPRLTSIGAITSGGGKLLIAGTGGSPLAASSDGTHWTEGMGFPGASLVDLATTGGRDLVVARRVATLQSGSEPWSRDARYPQFWSGGGPYADWSRGNLPATAGAPVPASLWPTSQGWFLLGSTDGVAGSSPRLWRSTDLASWSAMPPPRAGAEVLLESGGRLLLYDLSGSDGPWGYESADGQRWDRPAGAPVPLLGTVAGPGGLVAWSQDALYRSRDGRTWSAVGPRLTNGSVSGVCANGSVYVATAYTPGMPESASAPLVLSSRDGQSWTAVHPGLGAGIAGVQCARAGSRLVVIASGIVGGAPRVVASGSDDGAGWQRVGPDFDSLTVVPLIVRSSTAGAIVVTQSDPVSVSFVRSLAPGARPSGLAVWGSIDGRTWRRLGPPTALARVASLTAAEVDAHGTVHLLGTTEAGVNTFWTAPLVAA